MLNGSEMRKALKKWHNIPDHYVMGSNGVFLRSSFEEITQVEMLYVSVKSFQFYTKGNSENMWLKDKEEDNTGSPILISSIEDPRMFKSDDLLKNERSRFDRGRMDDFQVCSLIDNYLLKKFNAYSVSDLSERGKNSIFKELLYDHHLSGQMIRRCLGGWMPEWYIVTDI